MLSISGHVRNFLRNKCDVFSISFSMRASRGCAQGHALLLGEDAEPFGEAHPDFAFVNTKFSERASDGFNNQINQPLNLGERHPLA